MNLTRRLLAAVATAPLLLGTIAAHAPEHPENCRIIHEGDPEVEGDEIDVCQVRTYFHCPGEVKVTNVGLVAEGISGWDENEPAGSVQDGEGCGSGEAANVDGGNPETLYDTPFKGYFQGRIQSMTVSIHARDAASLAFGEEVGLEVYLAIDGDVLLDWVPLEDISGALSETGATAEFKFSIDNIGLISLNDDVDHDVSLTIRNRFTDQATAYVWDTTEVPSGITFNPVVGEAARLDAGA